jgi:hypothetical protein
MFKALDVSIDLMILLALLDQLNALLEAATAQLDPNIAAPAAAIAVLLEKEIYG